MIYEIFNRGSGEIFVKIVDFQDLFPIIQQRMVFNSGRFQGPHFPLQSFPFNRYNHL